MASNEARAKLIGWELRLFTDDELSRSRWAGTSDMKQLGAPAWFAKDGVYGRVPPYDTSLDACAELRAFVRARGETRTFVDALIKVLHDEWRSEDRDHRAGFTETRFDLIDATPAQQCAAFDATFKDELEKIQ